LQADARGTVTVTKASGVVRTYDHVRIRMFGTSSLRISSADGRGTLTIDHAACSYVGEIQRCLPYRTTLDVNGTKHLLDLERGTLYLNTTAGPLPMPHSSLAVPPYSIVLALRTERGTLISAMGRIDGEPK
jgi:hypothetical protein